MPPIPVIVFSALAVLAAAFVRGYSGFGFSMITVTSLTLVLPPALVVPSVLLMEVTASLGLLPKVWKEIDWPRLVWLWVGVALGTPLGVYILAHAPERPMRAGIGLVVLVLSILLWRGFKLNYLPGKKAAALTGALSGVLNGGAAVGGPPVILFYLSSPARAAVGRATLIAYFIATDLWAAGVCACHGLISTRTLLLFGLLLLPLTAGLALGARAFHRSDEAAFRRKVLLILTLLALATLGRAILK